jgi:enoyl-CoA hydratase/carnithine racemase
MTVIVETLAAGIMQIRINRPERMNALGVATVDALEAAISEVAQARVVLLRGSSRAFCAGADLKERAGMDASARAAHNRAINRVATTLESLEMPTIAVLNGVALGGGLEIALACDLRFAAASATLGLTEARVGAIPGAGGTQRLPRLIGTARAMKMMLSGEPVDASTAEAWNLVQDVAPDAELDGRVLDYARIVASRSPRALRTLKRVVRIGMAQSLSDALRTEGAAVAEIFASADYAEGLRAFAERRPPVFAE